MDEFFYAYTCLFVELDICLPLLIFHYGNTLQTQHGVEPTTPEWLDCHVGLLCFVLSVGLDGYAYLVPLSFSQSPSYKESGLGFPKM